MGRKYVGLDNMLENFGGTYSSGILVSGCQLFAWGESSLCWTGKLLGRVATTTPQFQHITPVKPGQWFIINERVYWEDSTDPGWKKRTPSCPKPCKWRYNQDWNWLQCALAITRDLPMEQTTEADHQNLQQRDQIQHQLTDLNLQARKGLTLAAAAQWHGKSFT